MSAPHICPEQVRVLFALTSEGRLYWRQSPTSSVRAGSEAGSFIKRDERVIVTIGGRKYAGSSLVYAHVHGRWPESRLGHRNGDRTDNRPQNLVLVANATRQRRHAKPLPLGVAKSGSRYKARIVRDYKYVHIGTFDTPEQAHQAYVHEHVRIHGMQSPYYEMASAYADCIDNGAGAEKC